MLKLVRTLFLVAVLAVTGILAAGCEPEAPKYQSCYPKGTQVPANSPYYDCTIEWCSAYCDDPERAEIDTRKETFLAPDGNRADECWAEKLGKSDHYEDAKIWCDYGGTYKPQSHDVEGMQAAYVLLPGAVEVLATHAAEDAPEPTGFPHYCAVPGDTNCQNSCEAVGAPCAAEIIHPRGRSPRMGQLYACRGGKPTHTCHYQWGSNERDGETCHGIFMMRNLLSVIWNCTGDTGK